MPTFFTPETFRFFRELTENNNKEWFDEHKPIYDQHVYQPIKDLVSLLSPAMHSIDPEFELRPHRAVSRIYRDVRFSKDKSPYKTCMWLTFQQPIPRENWTDIPGYFMEISAENYVVGMGLYQPKKKTMETFREEISYIPQEFREHADKDVLANGFEVFGEKYKRLIPSDLDEYFQTWVQRKGVYAAKTVAVNEAEVCSPDFYKKIEKDFLALQWLYQFMKEVSELSK